MWLSDRFHSVRFAHARPAVAQLRRFAEREFQSVTPSVAAQCTCQSRQCSKKSTQDRRFDLQSNCSLFHRVECGDQGFQAVLASSGLTLWLALSQHVIGRYWEYMSMYRWRQMASVWGRLSSPSFVGHRWNQYRSYAKKGQHRLPNLGVVKRNAWFGFG